MSATVWTPVVIPLGDEGELAVKVQQWEEPKRSVVETLSIEDSWICHCTVGVVRLVKVSSTRNVLCCDHCFLRLHIPSPITTIGGLVMYFRNV